MKIKIKFITYIALLFISNKLSSQTDSVKISKDSMLTSDLKNEESNLMSASKFPEYMYKIIHHDVASDNEAPAGIYKVVIRFMIDEEGSIKNIERLTNFGYGMEEEVIRVLLKSGKWKTTEQNNRKVRSTFSMPVMFLVNLDSVVITSRGDKFTLYEGIENEIGIDAILPKSEKIIVELDQGIIKKYKNRYKIDVNGLKTDRVLMKIFNRKGVLIQEVSFQIKPEKEAPAWLR